VCARAGLEGYGKSRPHWDSIPVASRYTHYAISTHLYDDRSTKMKTCMEHGRNDNGGNWKYSERSTLWDSEGQISYLRTVRDVFTAVSIIRKSIDLCETVPDHDARASYLPAFFFFNNTNMAALRAFIFHPKIQIY